MLSVDFYVGSTLLSRDTDRAVFRLVVGELWGTYAVTARGARCGRRQHDIGRGHRHRLGAALDDDDGTASSQLHGVGGSRRRM